MSFTRNPLNTEVQFLKGVGPRQAPLLQKLGLNTVKDVLLYLPRRYEDRTHLPPISNVRPGQWVTVRGRITHIDARPISGGRVILKAMLSDGKAGISLVWFNQPWVRRKLEGYRGELIAYGMVKEGSTWLEISSPEYELLDEEDAAEAFARLVPVYPLSEGVPQSLVRKAIESALSSYLGELQEPLPESMLKKYDLAPLAWSIEQIHKPDSDENCAKARRRLVFEEFFYFQMALAAKRAAAQAEHGIVFKFDRDAIRKEMALMLPFTLTGAQSRVIDEIWNDLERKEPMNRLLQGDVGSGKTAVAASAILAVVRSGYQAALMAPTEILAEQHAGNLQDFFEPVGIKVALLVGKLTGTQKRKAQERVASGQAQVAIGTHALIQEAVSFKKLGLVVIDEQHRFGVVQRAALREKGFGNPDVLVMTATPIPRTYSMAMYGDLDLSVIDELPPGRQPIKTHWRAASERPSIYDGVRKLIQEGRQAYFVCPVILESEKMQVQAAEDLYYRLHESVFPELRVGLLHGNMKSKEKEEVMDKFRAKELDILVSTTVIEVGVDVPNASVMVIEDANRFGLSQLHQLRGRVGRGTAQSYCILIADARSEEARARMDILVATNDGFKIAEEDLRIRGPGELAGTKQSGNLDFKIADLVRDASLLELAREAALKLAAYDPFLEKPQYALMKLQVNEKLSKVIPIAGA